MGGNERHEIIWWHRSQTATTIKDIAPHDVDRLKQIKSKIGAATSLMDRLMYFAPKHTVSGWLLTRPLFIHGKVPCEKSLV